MPSDIFRLETQIVDLKYKVGELKLVLQDLEEQRGGANAYSHVST